MKLSVGGKIAVLLASFSILIILTATWVCSSMIKEISETQYRKQADKLAATAALAVDAEECQTLRDAVVSVYHDMSMKAGREAWGTEMFADDSGHFSDIRRSETFQSLLFRLQRIREANGAAGLYLKCVEPEDGVCICLVDASAVEPCPPGSFEPLCKDSLPVLQDPGTGFPARITGTDGCDCAVAAAAPVRDKDGNVVCYAGVNISMDAIHEGQYQFMTRLSLSMAAVTLALCMLTLAVVERSVVRPVNMLSEAARVYRAKGSSGQKVFPHLNIRTGDEIECLYLSACQMENEINTYVSELVETNEKLKKTQKEAERMHELAHRDALTGVRNKMAFEQIMAQLEKELHEGQKEFGFVVLDLNGLKHINDSWGHPCGDVCLSRLSTFICDTFVHSPVFRIGGDEFAVVLKNSDFRRISELTGAFRERLAHQCVQNPWEKVSAAIGCALYDPTLDNDVESVFHRADQKMYEDKAVFYSRHPIAQRMQS